MTSFHASFDVERCQFASMKLSFVIVVWGSEFLLRIFIVIIKWSLRKRLSVTFQDRMGCKEGDAMVRSIADFEVPDIHVCLPSFKMFSWFLLIKLKVLSPLIHWSAFFKLFQIPKRKAYHSESFFPAEYEH